ncbi:MAG: YheU family protein, partial [Porticoccaceae bacterium]
LLCTALVFSASALYWLHPLGDRCVFEGRHSMIEIPPDMLTSEILRAIIEEFILREGTDYGDYEVSLERKIEQVSKQLQRGDILITFDPATENCTLLTRHQFQQYSLERQQTSTNSNDGA